MRHASGYNTAMRNRFYIVFFLIVATLAVYWPVFDFEFVNWDDSLLIYKNPYLDPPTISNTLHFWTEPKWLYMPLTITAWSTLAWLSQYMPAEPYGLNPALFHTANLIVHLMSVFVIFSILRILLTYGFRNGADDSEKHDSFNIDLAAAAGALIFALHPVQVESVAWSSELKDLLCGLFSFLAVREYLLFAFISSGNSATGTRAVGTSAAGNKNIHYIFACGAFLLALLSKPTAVVVPLVVFILDRWVVKRSLKDSGIALTGWFIVAGIFAVIANIVQHSESVLVTTPIWTRPFIAGDALAFYIYKLIWPIELGIDYGRRPDFVLQHWWGYATWIVPILVVSMVLLYRRHFLIPIGIFTASLLPVLGFVPFLFQNESTVTDHYLYIPMLGVTLAVSLTICAYRTKGAASIFLIVILLFGVRSYTQVYTWKDNTSLFKNSLGVNPRSFASYINFGLVVKYQGKVEHGIAVSLKARQLKPKFYGAYYNLAIAMGNTGNNDEAISNYMMALMYRPDFADAHYNLGRALVQTGKLNEAISSFENTIKYQPDNADAHYNLGAVLKGQGKTDKALFYFRNAIKIRRNFAEAHNRLGEILGQQGKLDEAISHFSEAITIRPDYADAHYNLGVAAAIKGNFKKAHTQFLETLRIRPGHQGAKMSLNRLQ